MPNPAEEQWTDDRLLHEGVWLVENQLARDPSEVTAWALFVRRVWTVRDSKNLEEHPVLSGEGFAFFCWRRYRVRFLNDDFVSNWESHFWNCWYYGIR